MRVLVRRQPRLRCECIDGRAKQTLLSALLGEHELRMKTYRETRQMGFERATPEFFEMADVAKGLADRAQELFVEVNAVPVCPGTEVPPPPPPERPTVASEFAIGMGPGGELRFGGRRR